MAVSEQISSYLDSLITRTHGHATSKANEEITALFITDLVKNIAVANGVEFGHEQHSNCSSISETQACLYLLLSKQQKEYHDTKRMEIALECLTKKFDESFCLEQTKEQRAKQAALVSTAMILGSNGKKKSQKYLQLSPIPNDKISIIEKTARSLKRTLGIEDLISHSGFRKHTTPIHMDLALDAESLDIMHVKSQRKKPFLLRAVFEQLECRNLTYKYKPREFYKYNTTFKLSDLALLRGSKRSNESNIKSNLKMDLAIRQHNLRDLSAVHQHTKKLKKKPIILHKRIIPYHHSLITSTKNKSGNSLITDLHLSQARIKTKLKIFKDQTEDSFISLSIGKTDPKISPLDPQHKLLISNIAVQIKDQINDKYRACKHFDEADPMQKDALKIKKLNIYNAKLTTLLLNFILENIDKKRSNSYFNLFTGNTQIKKQVHYTLLFEISRKIISETDFIQAIEDNKDPFLEWDKLVIKAKRCFELQSGVSMMERCVSDLRSHIRRTRCLKDPTLNESLNKYHATLNSEQRRVTRASINYIFSNRMKKEAFQKTLHTARLNLRRATKIFVRTVPKRPNHIKLIIRATLYIGAIFIAIWNKIHYGKFTTSRSESHAATMARQVSRLASRPKIAAVVKA